MSGKLGSQILRTTLILVCLVLAGLPGLAQRPVAAAPAVLPAEQRADLILVDKSDRRMMLLRGGAVIREYRIALGYAPQGHKQAQGDGRTPEGVYLIDRRNPDSAFHLSLGISYPRPQDIAVATRVGVDPGGQIMIHGVPNGRDAFSVGHPARDWTAGCIAVTNEEIEEIWSLVETGTAIVIMP